MKRIAALPAAALTTLFMLLPASQAEAQRGHHPWYGSNDRGHPAEPRIVTPRSGWDRGYQPRRPRYEAPFQPVVGSVLPRDARASTVNDPWRYDLPQARAGTRWVRTQQHLLLIERHDSRVLRVIRIVG